MLFQSVPLVKVVIDAEVGLTPGVQFADACDAASVPPPVPVDPPLDEPPVPVEPPLPEALPPVPVEPPVPVRDCPVLPPHPPRARLAASATPMPRNLPGNRGRRVSLTIYVVLSVSRVQKNCCITLCAAREVIGLSPRERPSALFKAFRRRGRPRGRRRRGGALRGSQGGYFSGRPASASPRLCCRRRCKRGSEPSRSRRI